MKKNEVYRGFRVKNVTRVDEIGVKVLDIVHEKSGAEIVHVVNDDDENVFAITCKTYPENSRGTPHVLEHVVLCGSEKFKVHDPFFAMIRRSSNTFMNAFTAKTWTAYPAASKITTDFYNLLDVYLDAVFHPRIEKASFKQEGHRLEFKEPDDPKSDLVYRGIVYNEMKGAYASASGLLWRSMMGYLFEGHTYGHDSGGDPEEIPELTHEELVKFHKKFYDPSKAVFFFYGNIPTEKHLDFIGERILDHAEKQEQIPPLELVKKQTEPRYDKLPYAVSDEDLARKTFVGISFITTNIKDRADTIGLTLLDSILMDTDASPLKHRLISSGMCVNADSAFDTDAREMPYSFIFRGCEEKDAEALEKLLFDSLEEICKKGIDQEQIETALHQLEFTRTEIAGDYGPYGLEIFGRTILPKLQGGSLTEGLRIHSLFEELRDLVKNKEYLPSLIKKYFLDNTHRSTLVMYPDKEYGAKQHQAEKDKLKKIKESLTEPQIKEIQKNHEEMLAYRNAKENEDLSCLPILSLKDLPEDVSYFHLEKSNHGNLGVYHHETFTNKVNYATLVFDLPQIEEIDLSYLRLFASVLTELGAGGRNYIDNLNHIQEHVGGVWTSLSLNVQRENTQTCYPTISICAKSLSRKSKEMMHILKDFILTPDYKDRERIKELISQTYTDLQQRLSNSAVGYALKQSASSFSSWNHVTNLWHGYPYHKFIEDLYNNLDQRIDTVIEKFSKLAETIFHLNNPQLVLTCDQEDWQDLVKNEFYGIQNLAAAAISFTPWIEMAIPKTGKHSARTIASQIAHNAQSIPTITMQSPQAAPLKIASYLFENLFVHRDVREKGGAYTSGVKLNILTGCIQFYSSKDPNIVSTYSAFDNAVEAVARGEFTDQDLLEAKLSYIQDVDGSVSPGSKAVVTYFQLKVGLTKEVRKLFREQLLAVTKADVIAAVKERLLPVIKEKPIRVTYAGKELLERDIPLFEKHNFPSLELEKA